MTAGEWRAAGAALAPLDGATVLLLIGESPVSLASAARGAADAVPETRRVAVFDLAGAFSADEPDGLIAAFEQGRSLNALARPLDDGSVERFVVHRGPGAVTPELASHSRWPRLVEGFKATGALLIIVMPHDFASARALLPLADRACRLAIIEGVAKLVPLATGSRSTPGDGSVAAIVPDSVPTGEHEASSDTGIALSATDMLADRATPLPRTTMSMRRVRVTPTNPSHEVRITPVDSRIIRRNRRRVLVGAATVMTVGALAFWAWYRQHTRALPVVMVASMTDSLRHLASTPPRPARRATSDTLTAPDIVNPGDSVSAAEWSVELVATNDRTDANLRLAEQPALPAGTLAPVLMGDDSGTWYKIVAGAFVDRTAAELLRRALRQVGAIDGNAGVVARLPLALRLDTALSPSVAKARASAYVGRGVIAYPLQIDENHATIYAGAFASPEECVLLLAELRRAGLEPQLAFRVGRTY